MLSPASGSEINPQPAALRGRRVLVVEDEYFIAMELQKAIEDAGGIVVGPVRSANEALAYIATDRPDCATVDLSLDSGPSFVVPRELKNSGIPFVFITGYDPGFVPSEFSGTQHIVKPMFLPNVIFHLSKLVATTWH